MRRIHKRVVSISGDLGSGKSSVSRLLADKLGWKYYSTGMAQRKIATEMGITTGELNRLSLSDISVDAKIDAVFKNPPWGDCPCVIDSRLAFYFLPNSFKVCLLVDPQIAAERIFHDMKRKGEAKYRTIKQAKEACAQRRALELARFMQNYNLDITNLNQFDLVIDTTNLSVEEVCDKIIRHLPFNV
ncbi:MAG: (d)CMP kinase [Alphaproteobacteria bacterium]|nr:(d)CMP kinase [Alphaproteobacteria bacterium]